MRLHLQKWKKEEDGAGKVKSYQRSHFVHELEKAKTIKETVNRLAGLCGVVAGEDDEQDVRQLHLQHPLHCGAPLRPQHKVNEHGDKNVVL